MMVLGLAGTARADFTASEIQRLTKAKTLLMDTENRSVQDILKEFEAMGSPQQQLIIYEAVAAAFRDVQEKYGEDSRQSREQLLAKIRLNMAYFQLGGAVGEQAGMGELNKLIRRKLKQYLPENIWDNPDLFHSLE